MSELKNRQLIHTLVKHEVYFFGIKTIFQYWISFLTQGNISSVQGTHHIDNEKPDQQTNKKREVSA